MPGITLASLTVDASAGSNGSLAGGPLTVTGHFEWDGGALAATVNLPVGATGTIAGPGNGKGIGDSGIGLPGQLNVSGTLQLSNLSGGPSGSPGSLFLGGLSSRGVVDVASGATLTSTGTDTVEAGCCGAQNGTLINGGTVDVTDGTLALSGAEFQQSNAVVVGSGALLDDDAPLTLGSGSSYSGAGRMLLDANADPAMLQGNISLGSGFQLELGPQACMDGTSTISGAGTLDFTGGNLAANLTIAKGTTMHVTGPAGKDMSTLSCGTTNGHVINDGTIVDDQGNFSFGGSGTLTNQAGATFSLAPGATMSSDSCCNNTKLLFTNAGTLNVPAPPSGVASGTPAAITALPVTNTGTINVASGQQLLLSQSPGTLRGGTYEGPNGTILVQDGLTASGTLTLDPSLTFDLDTNGSLDGVFSAAGSGTFDWTGGDLSGTISMPSTIPINVSGTTRHQVTLRPNAATSVLTTHGPVSIASGTTSSPDTVWVNPGNQWVNAGTLTVAANTELAAASCCGPTYNLKNAGTLTVAAGAGTAAADGLTFDNAGKLMLSSGTLTLGQFEQTAGSTTLAGGNISDPAEETLLFASGALTGHGTISGPVRNGATVQPSVTGGALKITGTYDQTSTGTLVTQLDGTTPGNGFGQLDVSGAATLAGNADAVTVSGFKPTSGQGFPALLYGSRSGQFSTLAGTPGFEVAYKAPQADLVFGIPWITALSPNSGATAGGNTVTISGGDFTAHSTVHFGSTASPSVAFVSATELKALAPAHAAGTVQVKVTNAVGASTPSPTSTYTY
jgi:hypothetical protein